MLAWGGNPGQPPLTDTIGTSLMSFAATDWYAAVSATSHLLDILHRDLNIRKLEIFKYKYVYINIVKYI